MIRIFARTHAAVLEKFTNYFETNWVGRERNSPKFKIEWWNLYYAVLGGLSGTNYEIEGWHCAFNARVEVAHPTVFTLINHLKLQQGQTEFLISNSLGQGCDGGPRATYREKTQRLQELVRSDLAKYIVAAAHCIKICDCFRARFDNHNCGVALPMTTLRTPVNVETCQI